MTRQQKLAYNDITVNNSSRKVEDTIYGVARTLIDCNNTSCYNCPISSYRNNYHISCNRMINHHPLETIIILEERYGGAFSAINNLLGGGSND